MPHHFSMCLLNRVLCSWWNWDKVSTVWKQTYNLEKAVANTEDSQSFIHTPTPRLASWSKETNWSAQNCKSRQICYCLHYLSTQHRHSRLMRTSGIHLEHTITFVVCSVCSDFSVWSSMIFYSPVLWFRSLVSCPPAFVVLSRPLIFLSWSVIEELLGSSFFHLLMVFYRGQSPVLLFLSPALLCLRLCTFIDCSQSWTGH